MRFVPFSKAFLLFSLLVAPAYSSNADPQVARRTTRAKVKEMTKLWADFKNNLKQQGQGPDYTLPKVEPLFEAVLGLFLALEHDPTFILGAPSVKEVYCQFVPITEALAEFSLMNRRLGKEAVECKELFNKAQEELRRLEVLINETGIEQLEPKREAAEAGVIKQSGAVEGKIVIGPIVLDYLGL